MLNELARELGQPEIAETLGSERAKRVREALKGRRVLLVLDNLETLREAEQDQLFTFMEFLPDDCKALLTSRVFVGNKGLTIDLDKLDQPSALDLLAQIAAHNKQLAKSPDSDRIKLYKETEGRPLLLRRVAGQVGQGACSTIADALIQLRSGPGGNDALAFVFEDLLAGFSPEQTALLATLTFPSQSVDVLAIAEISGVPLEQTRATLKVLSNRALVVSDEAEQHYALVPLVADFLRLHRREVVKQTGDRLAAHAYMLIEENGYREHGRFPVLDAAWGMVAPALPLLLVGSNARLQTACDALADFLRLTGRWDELLFLSQQAEAKAVAASDEGKAGWRAYQAGWVYWLRQQADEVLDCADRAAAHWQAAQAGIRERSLAIRRRGQGHELKMEYSAAIAAFHKALELRRTLGIESPGVAMSLNDLANCQKLSGDFAAADKHYREALRLARSVNYEEGIANSTGHLADRALDRNNWRRAEILACKALILSETMGHRRMVASNCHRIAKVLVRKGRSAEALPYARRAVEIYVRLGLPDLDKAQRTLEECAS